MSTGTNKKKSGCENRKRKKEMEEQIHKLPKLDSFLMSNKSKVVQNEVSTIYNLCF